MSEKPTTTEAPSMVQSAVAAVAKYIPGADPSAASKSKNKKGKKAKTQTGTPPVEGGLTQATTAESTPTAQVAVAPTREELPSDLVADKKEMEKELKEDAEKEKAQGVKARSPAEELVYKRIKLISKKIQRMASYKDKDASLLNADQTAALKTLPGLEGAQKELEDILKGLENIENDAAAKKREEKGTHNKALESAKTEAVESYKQNTLPLLSSLIAIHASLHPQDASANFMPPQLPAHLQDVSKEDVKVVDGLYNRLKEGENLDAIVEEVEAKEGSSVYYLITGKPNPSASAASDAPNFSQPTPETNDLSAEAAGEAAAVSSAEPTATTNMNAFEYSPEVSTSASKEVAGSEDAAAGTMSFMQSSELEVPKTGSKEVKQVAQEQQINGPAMGLETKEPASDAQTAKVQTTDSGVNFSQTTVPIDWADDDEMTSEADINALKRQFGMPVEAAAIAPSMPVLDPSVDQSRPAGLPPIPQHARGGGGRGRGESRRIGGLAASSGNWRKTSGPANTEGGENAPIQTGNQPQIPTGPREHREPNPNGPNAPHANGFRGRGRGGFHQQQTNNHQQQAAPAEDDGFQNVSRRKGPTGPASNGPNVANGAPTGPLNRGGNRGRGGSERGGGRGGSFRGGRGGSGFAGGEGRPPQAPRQPSATASATAPAPAAQTA